MAKSTQPKNAVMNVKLNQVFTNQTDDMKGTLAGIFAAVGNMQMGTPGEKARFDAASEIIKNSEIIVKDGAFKIVTTPQNAEIIARGLAVPNKDGSLDVPSVADVLDPQKLEPLLMRSINYTDAFKTVMTNMSTMQDGKVKEADKRYFQALAQMDTALKEIQGMKALNDKLKEQNQNLVTTLANKTEENEELEKKANYITPRGKKIPAKPAAKVAGIVLAGLLGLSLIGNAWQAVRGRNLANQHDALKSDYAIAQQTINEQNITIQGLQDSIQDYKDDIDDLNEDIDRLQDQIDGHYEKYQAVVELAQNAGFAVADDIEINDLFMTIIDGLNNGQTTDGAQVAYTRIAQIMQEYGITQADLTGKDGKYDPSKVEAEIREAFTEALMSAKTIADTEKAVAGLLEGTGKKLSDFKSMAGAIAYAQEYNENAMDTLNAKIEAQEATIEAKEARIAELERQVANNTGDSELVAKLQGEIAELKSDLKDAKDELAETKETLETTQEALTELTGDYNELDSAYDKIYADYEKAQGTIEEMAVTIAGLGAEKEALEDKNKEQTDTIQKQEDTIADLTDQLNAEKDKNAALEKENDELENANENLEEENARLEQIIADSEQGGTDIGGAENGEDGSGAGNVNVGDTDPDDEKKNPGQEDVPIATPGTGDEDPNKGAQPGDGAEDGLEGELGED